MLQSIHKIPPKKLVFLLSIEDKERIILIATGNLEKVANYSLLLREKMF